jgi:hypothetical protein
LFAKYTRDEPSRSFVHPSQHRWPNAVEAASVLKNVLPDTPIILFTMYTDLHADSLYAFIGVDFISNVDGIPRLLERVDALLPPTLPNEEGTQC